jgi:cobalt/nickel transport system permease protein
MRAEAELFARGDSPLHRWDARGKLVALGLLAGVLVLLHHLETASLGALAALALLLVGRLPWSLVLRLLAAAQALLLPCLILLPFSVRGEILSAGPLRLSREGLELALLLNLRALALLTLVFGTVYSTPMVVLLRALQSLGIPRRLVEITLITYRYLFTLGWELTRMRWALAVRGFRNRPRLATYRTLAQVLGVTLLRSLERTERVRQALQTRGFSGHLRTLHNFRARPADWVMSGSCILLAVALLIMDRRWSAGYGSGP